MRDPLLANTPYEFYTFWDNLWHHSFAHFLTDPPTIPCVNRVMRVTCQRVADAHRLWGATSSPTKFHLSSCHASSFCNNLASLALQLMEREPIIQHFGVWVEIQLEAQHPQLRYLAPSQIWGLRSLSLLLEGEWALSQCRQLNLHLLINSANLFRADKWSSESGGCSMVLLWQLSDPRLYVWECTTLVASRILQIAHWQKDATCGCFNCFILVFFGLQIGKQQKDATCGCFICFIFVFFLWLQIGKQQENTTCGCFIFVFFFWLQIGKQQKDATCVICFEWLEY